jgi:hypothetical protein
MRRKRPDNGVPSDIQALVEGVPGAIAWGQGQSSPELLVRGALKAMEAGDPGSALRLLQRATDRNDDFVNGRVARGNSGESTK